MRHYTLLGAFVVCALFLPAPAFASGSILNTPAASGAPSEPAGATDHSLVVRQFGLRVATEFTAPGNLVMIGGRYWFTDRFGVDPAIGFRLFKPAGAGGDGTQFNFGAGVGVPILLSQFKHISFYVEPALDFEFWHIAKGNNQWGMGLQALFVSELTLGFIGVPRLAATAGLGLQIRLFNNGNANEFTFGTANVGSTLASLLVGTAGVIYYF